MRRVWREDPEARPLLVLIALTLVLGVGGPAAGILAGCAGADPLITTGETLVSLSHTFEATGQAMNAAWDSGALTADQYRAWADFARAFKLTYHQARLLWEAARQAGRPGMERAVAVAIAELAAELATFRPPPARAGPPPGAGAALAIDGGLR